MTKSEESCSNCRRCLNLHMNDYSNGGCERTVITNAFVCLAFQEEGTACIMKGSSKNGSCEYWESKENGHWIILENCSNQGTYCSVCHTKVFDFTHLPKKKLSQYCPHCGARMEYKGVTM